MKIGFLGAGRMGRPMLDHLIKAGHDTTVFVLNDDEKAVAERDGLPYAQTVADTVRDAEAVWVVVLKDEHIRSVLLGPDGALEHMAPGGLVIIHTTSDPETSQLVADAGAARGIRVLDAAISGGPPNIVDGTLTLWVGADEADLAAARPLLGLYADPVMHVGPLGNGQKTKLVNNALFGAQVGLAVDAVRLAGALGIESSAILAAVQQGSGASRGLQVVAGSGDPLTIGNTLGEFLLKDVTVVREVAARMGADLGIIGEVLSSPLVEERVLRPSAPAS